MPKTLKKSNNKKINNINKRTTKKRTHKNKISSGGDIVVVMFKNYQKTKPFDPTTNKKHLNTCQCLDYEVSKRKQCRVR